jgi:BioD-like phosphotransacetylase family protein
MGFLSTSLNINIAKSFNPNTILIIDVENNLRDC